MNATSPTANQAATPATMKPNQVWITGRIDSVRSFDSQGRRQFEHRVVLPAVDQYTQPSYVLVQASGKLAALGEDVKVLCQIGGYRDRFKTKDDEYVETARMMLRALD